jgi:DNA-directed RNA polymerase specialized sigma24 family protein
LSVRETEELESDPFGVRPRLGSRLRELFRHSAVYGLGSIVARILGVSPAAAKSRIYRAARRLRPELTAEEVI